MEKIDDSLNEIFLKYRSCYDIYFLICLINISFKVVCEYLFSVLYFLFYYFYVRFGVILCGYDVIFYVIFWLCMLLDGLLVFLNFMLIYIDLKVLIYSWFFDFYLL